MKKTVYHFAMIFLLFTLSNSQDMKLMTYNIRFNNPNDGENAWSKRKEILVNQIRFYEPDIFGIQEGLESQIKYIVDNLKSYQYVGVGRADVKEKGSGEFSAIFFSALKFKKLDSGTFWLSETPEKTSRGWDASLNRICTYILLKHKKTGNNFWVFNTHFDHRGKKAREKSAELIIQKIKSINKDNLPLFLMGDFNLKPDESPIQFIKKQLNDSWEISQQPPFGPVGTINSFDVCKTRNSRIDYIFVSKNNIMVNKYGVLANVKDIKYPSDHFPVFIEANLQSGFDLNANTQVPALGDTLHASIVKQINGSIPLLVQEKEVKIFAEDDNPLDIGNRRELFIDHYLVNKFIDTRLVLHKPRDEGEVIQFDKTWEGPFCGYCTVINDGGNYKAYYRGIPEAGHDGNSKEVTCYAQSKDGITWEKPNLAIYEIMASRENNVILANDAPFSHNFSPFLDTNPECKIEEKFKAVAGTIKSGLLGFTSKDGIHWKKIAAKAIFRKGIFDSQNVVFWSQEEKCYICYFRTWTRNGFSGIRTISRTTSKDFIHWAEPKRMDFGYTPLEHLYTNQTHPYFRAQHIYVAIAARFMPKRQVLSEEQALRLKVNPKYFKDCSDVIFMTSRGGNSYERTFMESFIRPAIGLENWVSRSNYPALNVVQTGAEEMSIYVNQNYAQPTAHLRRYSLRLDGFSSIRASYSGGEMITKLLTFNGKQLAINFATSAAGEIRVEIQDKDRKPIPGFTLSECQALIGNTIKQVVNWKNGSDVSKLAGKEIRLRFSLKDADLYSLKFD